MSRVEKKSIRLSQIETLLLDHPEGLTKSQIADRINVHRSTVSRNLCDMIAPVYEDNGRLFIDRECYLVHLHLSLHEALSVHLAGRLLSTCIERQNPHTASAFRKLGLALETLAPQISRFVRSSANSFDDETKRNDPHYQQVLEILTLSCANNQKVRLWYRSAEKGVVKEHIFCPYFIEVAAAGQAIYVIGQIEPECVQRTYRLERIERIELTAAYYTFPNDFDSDALFSQAWGIWYSEQDPVTVRLRFSAAVAKRVRETRWHLSETIAPLDDGSLLWRAEIAEPREMMPWIRGWGCDVEVLEPVWLRERIAVEAKRTAALYEDCPQNQEE